MERMAAKLMGHAETIGQRMERDLGALLPLPGTPYGACERQAGRNEFPVAGKVQNQRLLGPGGRRPPGHAGKPGSPEGMEPFGQGRDERQGKVT